MTIDNQEIAAVPGRVALLERAFGNGLDAKNPLGHVATVAADEESACNPLMQGVIRELGLGSECVPETLGGRLVSLSDMIRVFRSVYRRDPALGLGHGMSSFMAGLNVWLAGDPHQQELVASSLLAGKSVACAYHEFGHGNDLTANELRADLQLNGAWAVSGRKEVISNADQCQAMVLFARTANKPGLRSHTLLLLDEECLQDKAVIPLNRYPTSGMRGARLTGMEFHGAHLPASTSMGRVGSGTEVALKSFQLSRIALPGATIGLLDTALRCAFRGAAARKLYGGTVVGFPLSRSILATALLDLQIADAFTTVAARLAALRPAALSPYAAAVKALVPRILMHAADSLAELLGSQFYLRSGDQALFQKLLRDVQPTSFGHASRASCLMTLLPQLAAAAQRTWTNPDAEPAPRAAFTDGPLPRLEVHRLRIISNGDDPLAATLLSLPAGASPFVRAEVEAWRGLLGTVAGRALVGGRRNLGADASNAAFSDADRWAGALAAAACLGVHLNTGADEGITADPAWAVAAMRRVRSLVDRASAELTTTETDLLFRCLSDRVSKGLTLDRYAEPTGA